MDFFEEQIKKLVKEDVNLTETSNPDFGDYCFGCFELAKKLKKSPDEIAKSFEKKLKPNNYIEKICAINGYVNLFLNKKLLAKNVLQAIFEGRDAYGSCPKRNKTVVIDFSSPNIAKPFGIGHLRSTVIGNSLAKIYRFLGYNVIGVNHLGDWGTQFGKLIVAYKKWGKEAKLQQEPIKYLLELYVQFHRAAEKDEKLAAEARAWFKKLEEGNKEATELWELFRELSLEEFKRIYKILDVKFDNYHGESFYNNKMRDIIKTAKAKKIAVISDGALVIELEGMPPLILQKSDGATTYATRDLAAIAYRIKQYHPDRLVYVVGSEQKLHFEQLARAAKMLGLNVPIIHINFGLIMFPEGRMSTRKGNIIFLEEVLNRSVELALNIIKEKNPDLESKEATARNVGVGAVIFADLSNERARDIKFEWDRILDFEGETAPYIQYTHARARSILRKCRQHPSPNINFEFFEKEELNMISLLYKFPKIVEAAGRNYKPHVIARYLIELSQTFNEFYHKCPVICDLKQIQKARLLLVDCARQVIENGLHLLGIKAPERM